MNWLIKNLFCRPFSHNWRRLHKKEGVPERFAKNEFRDIPRTQIRVCRWCGDDRLAPQRKAKAAA